jgi:ubiquinol-cytochrome c reductase cytochrome c subunit
VQAGVRRTRIPAPLIAAVAALAVLVLPAVAAADPPDYGIVTPRVPPRTSAFERGRQLYAANCATCHGATGEGVKVSATRGAGGIRGMGPPLSGVGALAADFYLRTGYMPLERVGIQPRRSRVLFNERQLRGLVTYVASLGTGPPVPRPHPERGNVAAGLRLFTEHCAGCHQVVTEGGYVTGAVAPPLEEATPTQIAEAVRIGPYVMPTFSKKDLSDRELDSIIAYVEASKKPHDEGGWSIGHLGPVPEGIVTWFLAAVALVATCVVIGERMKRR